MKRLLSKIMVLVLLFALAACSKTSGNLSSGIHSNDIHSSVGAEDDSKNESSENDENDTDLENSFNEEDNSKDESNNSNENDNSSSSGGALGDEFPEDEWLNGIY